MQSQFHYTITYYSVLFKECGGVSDGGDHHDGRGQFPACAQ
ncbi:hypothetical protein DFA_09416 [Cavenderia fasciculata]|uniref:Uncharacterized protein n=1 Tax=Cavenderia fasciculata TaxID=261658 RepID=F4Q7K3_CACFS|nr:uncharacterized protein DFA_09416 [Cavenderia fasciculata]EGG16385.1 hypothetical protein DFA_09416 [Cavenderia fasciculata]|eukprot:XP_004354769.1 hypothetical protein DFA_09416 [Cavenderia fasciculata]